MGSNDATSRGRPVSEVVTKRGKELRVDDSVAAARELFANESVQVLPVLDGMRYVGAIDRASIASDASDSAAVQTLAAPLLPTATAATPLTRALDALDRHGASRLVVLDDDGVTYVGLVCRRSDGEQLCIDAECHPHSTT